MKKFLILWMILGISLLIAVQARAEGGTERKNGVQVGFLSGSVASSSSPITDIGVSTNDGKEVRFVHHFLKDFDASLGYSQSSYNLSMDGADLGKIDSATFSSTARFRFEIWKLRPYVGWGVHYTSIDKALLADGSLKTSAASGFGPIAEWGIAVHVGGGFYVDLNTSQYFWSANGIRFETNTGNALISEISISNPHWTGISIGKSF